jgi:V8-like Glu-specific endopeptidase
LPTLRNPYHRQIGRLFLRRANGKSGLCSASLVTSGRRLDTVVVTAGHCVDKDPGTRFVFVPAYQTGAANPAPWGAFRATGAQVVTNYNNKVDNDYAFIKVSARTGFNPNDPMTVAPLPTGVASTSVWATPGLSAFRIEYGAIPAKDVHQYGYPSSVGSGKFAIHTNSETTFTAKFVSFPTLQGPGSSGGPHLIGKACLCER